MNNSSSVYGEKLLQDNYQPFCLQLFRLQQKIPVPGLLPSQINSIFKEILLEHPEFFWFDGKWSLLEEGATPFAYPLYLFPSWTAHSLLSEINSIADQLVKSAEGAQCNSYDTAKYFYDWLLKNVDYGMGRLAGQTIYDVFVERKAVCKGLSKAFQFLSQKAGIPVGLAEGTIDERAKHIWNTVEINSARFNVDVSMGYGCFSFLFHGNDQNDPYRCFMVSDEQLSLTHRQF